MLNYPLFVYRGKQNCAGRRPCKIRSALLSSRIRSVSSSAAFEEDATLFWHLLCWYVVCRLKDSSHVCYFLFLSCCCLPCGWSNATGTGSIPNAIVLWFASLQMAYHLKYKCKTWGFWIPLPTRIWILSHRMESLAASQFDVEELSLPTVLSSARTRMSYAANLPF